MVFGGLILRIIRHEEVFSLVLFSFLVIGVVEPCADRQRANRYTFVDNYELVSGALFT
jgi:hypothetical protein